MMTARARCTDPEKGDKIAMTTAPTDSKIVDAYRARTPTSARLAERARERLPSGVTHDSRYFEPYPLYVERAAGSKKWDVDGNEYVDYAGGHGALLLGHNDPAVVEAVERQLASGTHYGGCHELEVDWAEWISRLIPSAERVRFTSSGTEATLLALRLARAFTGKTKLLRFFGHFHGWQDHVAQGAAAPFDIRPPGVLPGIASEVVMAPAGDVQATQQVLDEHDDLAAVIVEPTGASWGQLPLRQEFLVALREMTASKSVVLIFDEVITGFRCAPGGAQSVFGVTPDLTTLAKILAGGLPGGAVAGRREILEHLAFVSENVSPEKKISHHGTFNANPLSAAAGVATLEIVAAGEVCQRANDYAERLRNALDEVCREASVPWTVYGAFSGFHIYTNPSGVELTAQDINEGRYDAQVLKARQRPELLFKLRLGMLLHGVEIFAWPGGPTSAVHDENDLDRTVEAFRATLDMLKEEGEVA